jgi:peptidyl-prolyl cis-trans isomerase SurA
MKKQMKEQALKQKLQEKYLGTSEPTRLQVKDFYTRYQDSLPVLKNDFKLSHLQMSVKADVEILKKAYKTCDSLIKLLDKGVSFSHLAKTYSDDPSGESGGDLGFTKRGVLDPDYERAVFRLNPGEYTRKPVKTQFGFHVIKVTARRDIEIRSSHILIRTIPTKSDTLGTIALLDSIRKVAVDSSNFTELVAKFSEDKATKAKGGNLGWFTEKSMNEEYKEVIKGLSEKELSEPVLINGSYHLFRLDKQLAERRLSLDEDWKQISLLAQNFIMNKRLNGLLKNWRKKVYIEDRSGYDLFGDIPESP